MCGGDVSPLPWATELFPRCQGALQRVKVVSHTVDLSHSQLKSLSEVQMWEREHTVCSSTPSFVFTEDLQWADSFNNESFYKPGPRGSVVLQRAGATSRVIYLFQTSLWMDRTFLMSRDDHRLWRVGKWQDGEFSERNGLSGKRLLKVT